MRTGFPGRYGPLALAIACTAPAEAETRFDSKLIESLGLAPDVQNHFASGSTFAPGMQRVTISVNGVDKGLQWASFDERSRFMLDPALARRLAIRLDDSQALAAPLPLVELFPHAQIDPEPGSGKLNLVIPSEAFATGIDDPAQAPQTGSAALLNYNLSGYTSRAQRYLFGALQAGANFHGWAARADATLNLYNNRWRYESMAAYVQKSLPGSAYLLSAGQITVTDSVFSGVSMLGVQLLPESALRNGGSDVPPIEGIAQTQARVEIFQSGALVYATVVPPGPFSLRNLPLRNISDQIEVVVIEADGHRQRFSVPFAMAQGSLSGTPGVSMALGRTYNDGERHRPNLYFATASTDVALSERLHIRYGGLLSQSYQSAAAGLRIRVTPRLQLNALGYGSHYRPYRASGVRLDLSGTMSFPALRTALGFSYSQRSSRYFTINDVAGSVGDFLGNYGRFKRSVGLSASLSPTARNALSVGASQNSYFSRPSAYRVYAQFSQELRRARLSATLERSTGAFASTAAYAYLTMPLGSRASVSATVSSYNDMLTAGATYSNTLESRNLSYSVGAQHNDHSRRPDISANMAYQGVYTSSQFGVASYASGYTASAGLAGAVVLHGLGLDFSPNRVQDTFGIVNLGLPNVRIEGAGGSARTGANGRAVLSQIEPYGRSVVRVDTSTLPRNVDLKAGIESITTGRGSVVQVAFDTVQAYRALVTIVREQGPTPKLGTSITDEKGNYVGIVGPNGSVYIEVQADRENAPAHIRKQLILREQNEAPCAAEFDPGTAAQTNGDARMAQLTVTCKPFIAAAVAPFEPATGSSAPEALSAKPKPL